jgi:hypothetical protein
MTTNDWHTIIAPANYKLTHIYSEEKDNDRYEITYNYPSHVSALINISTALTEHNRSLVLIIDNKSSYPVFVKIKFDGKPILDKSLS